MLCPLYSLVRGHAYGSDEASGVCFSCPCDVVGSAVVHRRADDGKAQRGVYAILEVEHLKRDEALVMIHGDDGVPFALLGPIKDGVWWIGARYMNPLKGSLVNGRGNDLGLFISEQAPYSCMGV